MNRPLVLAMTGASGTIYAARLLDFLMRTGHEVHLTISPSAALVARQELGIDLELQQFDPAALCQYPEHDTLPPKLDRIGGRSSQRGEVHYHRSDDFMTPIASGSFLTGGMVVCPCSGSTLAGVVHAAGANLIHRAAEVHLKERRPLVLVPRETPLSAAQLENMHRACQMGAVVLPAAPGWYHGVASPIDLVDFIVGRILDQLGIEHALMQRWTAEPLDD